MLSVTREFTETGRSTSAVPDGSKIFSIRADKLVPNRAQPRRCFDENAIGSLADSISRYGLLQPLSVRRLPTTAEGVKYEIIAGERRYRAAMQAGMDQLPCIIINVDDRTSAELALIENIQREGLNMFEQAGAIAALIDLYGMTQEQIAAHLSASQSYVANKLRLLRLSPACRSVVTEGHLTERHARALLRLPESRRTAALEKIARDKLSVREADRLVDAMLAAPKDTPGPCRSTVPMVGDVRLFVNTLQHAVDLMTQRGIPAVTSCEQADGFLEYTVRIPTATPAPLPVPNTLPACHEPEMPSGEGSSLGEEDEFVRS